MNFGVYVVKTINIRCKSAINLDLNELHVLQKDLKSLSKEDFEKYKKEILETGYAFPIKAWEDPDGNWQIVGGTQSYRTLLQMRDVEGYVIPKIPVSIIEADNLRQACHRVLQDASNYGKVEKEGLYEFMQMASLSVEELKSRFSPTDIDLEEFEQEFFELENEAAKAEIEDDVPENVEPKTKLGDLYKLGDHRLLCGDSTDLLEIQKLLGGNKAEMLFTDPPYGINAVSKDGKVGGGTAQAPARKYRPVLGDQDTSVARKSWEAVCKLDIKAMIIWGGNYFTDFLPPSPCWIVWDKERPEGLTFADGEMAWTNFSSPLKFMRHQWDGYHRASERDQERVHPTQKPAALAEWCFKQYGEPKIVLDLFGGSGSTLIACQKTNRKCFIMELDPHYCDVIIARWEQYTGQKAQLITV